MALYYPSFDALRLADKLLEAIGERAPGYKGRVGVAWFWRLPGGILVTARLDCTVTEERWDVLRGWPAAVHQSGDSLRHIRSLAVRVLHFGAQRLQRLLVLSSQLGFDDALKNGRIHLQQRQDGFHIVRETVLFVQAVQGPCAPFSDS